MAAWLVECLDRIYLNAYVPILQTSAHVVAFLSGHLGSRSSRRCCSGNGGPIPPVGGLVRRVQ